MNVEAPQETANASPLAPDDSATNTVAADTDTDAEEDTEDDKNFVANVKRILLLDKDTNVTELAASLKDTHCVVLYISIYESFLKKHRMEHISAMFVGAQLPNLLGLKIDRPESKTSQSDGALNPHENTPQAPRSFPIQALSSILRTARKMEYLIFDLKLWGRRDDYRVFGETVGHLSVLQCVGATMSVTTDGDNDNEEVNVFDPLMHSLSKLPTLSDVIIKGDITNPTSACLGALQTASLVALCRLPKLTSLYLFLFVLSDENVSAMAQAIADNSVVEELCINCRLGLLGSQHFSNMLRKSKTLKEVILIIFNYQEKQNDCLDSSSDSEPANLQSRIDSEIADGVALSKTVQEFLYQGGPDVLSTNSHVHFRNAAKTNYVLEKMCLRTGTTDADKALEAEINFFLKLNAQGQRAKLLRHDNSVSRGSRWVNAMANADEASKLSILHYYLSTDPSLCILPQSRQQQLLSSIQPLTTGRTNNSNADGLRGKRKRLYRDAKYKRICYTS